MTKVEKLRKKHNDLVSALAKIDDRWERTWRAMLAIDKKHGLAVRAITSSSRRLDKAIEEEKAERAARKARKAEAVEPIAI